MDTRDGKGISLLVGLGNPGSQYKKTRHNAGVWFLDELVRHHQVTLHSESKFHGATGLCQIENEVFRFFQPLTFMNDSGIAVRSILQFHKITPEKIVVVHDELDFEPGIIRLKKGGGHGGHNGLRDIITHLNTPDFYRLRLGIGHPGDKRDVTPYVLGEPSLADHEKIKHAIHDGLGIMNDLVLGNFERAMREINGI